MLLRSIIRKCNLFFTMYDNKITRYTDSYTLVSWTRKHSCQCHKVEKVENLYVYIKILNSNKNDILVTIHMIWYFNVAIKKIEFFVTFE